MGQAGDVWAAAIPFLLATLAVGGAYIGSRLSPGARRRAERWALLPLLVVLLVAEVIWLGSARRWIALGLTTAFLSWALVKFVRHLRSPPV